MANNRFNDRPKQPTPKELTNDLLGFLERKFYAGDRVSFAKDRSRLLAWVVLWPAAWLTGRGVSVPADRYRQIFLSVMMAAVVHGSEKVKYRPAWLRTVIQSHFRLHGDEYYAEAKSARSLVENAMVLVSRPLRAQSSPIRELAAARAILVANKTPKQSTAKEQLSLL